MTEATRKSFTFISHEKWIISYKVDVKTEFDFLIYDLWFLHEYLLNAVVHLISSERMCLTENLLIWPKGPLNEIWDKINLKNSNMNLDPRESYS